jgi:uncharacterized protein
MEKVSFMSEGVTCSAYLARPEGEGEARHPAVVLGHGFGIRKESLVVEAEHLAAAGFVALAIDYRTFGESGGEPRGSLIPLNEVEDFRNAITFLQHRGDVDPNRIGIWGASFGGGVVIMTAALDRRVRAVVAMAPIVSGRRWINAIWGNARFEELRDLVEADRIRRWETGDGERIALVGKEFPTALPHDSRSSRWHRESMEQRGRPLLEGTHELTMAAFEKVLEWEPDRFIDRISPRPLLIVTPGGWDIMHIFEHTKEAYARAGEPKRLIPLQCDQMDVYLPPWQGVALDYATAWFQEYLAPPRF